MYETQTNDETLPPPVTEGDWVELREPYKPMWSTLASQVRQTMKDVALRVTGERHPDIHQDIHDLGFQHVYESGDIDRLVSFDQGVVVDIVSRFRVRQLASSIEEHNRVSEVCEDGYPRNVAIHPFDSVSGLMYRSPGPKPQYVDCHVGELILRHKAPSTWGETYSLNIGEAYEQRFDIPDPLAEVTDG